MELLSTSTHIYLCRAHHCISFSRSDSSLVYEPPPLDLLKTATLVDKYVFFLGVIRIFGYNFPLVCKPAVPAVSFIDICSSNTQRISPHPPLEDGTPCYPLRVNNIIVLHAVGIDKYIHFLLRNAIADVCRHCYIDTSRHFSPDDSYCWNRHLYPSQISSTEQIPRLRLETIIGECMAYIFSGFYEQWMIGPSSYLSLRMERCIDNSGHRYFNRGINSAGYTANTARLRLYHNTTLVYTLFRGSLPLTFNQPPTYKFTPAIHFPDGAHEEQGLIQFNSLLQRHISLLLGNLIATDAQVLIVNLLKNDVDLLDDSTDACEKRSLETADEQALTAFFTESMRKTADLRRKNSLNVKLINYNIRRHSSIEYYQLADNIAATTVLTSSGDIGSALPDFIQKCYPRINCLDCVDRTTLFQTILLQKVFKSYAQTKAVDLTGYEHVIQSMSFACGEVCSYSYMNAPPQRRLANLHKTGVCIRQIDTIYDICNALFRYICNRYTQQINAYNSSIFNNQSIAYQMDTLACLNLPVILVIVTWTAVICDVLCGYLEDSLFRVLRLCSTGTIIVLIVLILTLSSGNNRRSSNRQQIQ
ncbi:Suppressor of actin 1 [Giardia lamblia P15]|uniref:Suppressor of actin 1 n=1 Tax=Giardia intestinalis (strain P15) TaxID=658858 RepID=E1F5L8_GIAIA|nr:Suppressor of actin 1 [Giardia lamblia P15]